PFNEGIPNSLIEPMACGKPVVATDIDQVSELVVDGVNGFLVPPGNAMALANALDRLVTDPSLRRQMGQAARRTVEERFSFTVALDRYRTLYRRLLDLS
ncbi:MAG: glycosyltransferase, partial [Magnetococcales bacterium]|nr:glycosyltransferase [Magnetococcales bacterium]